MSYVSVDIETVPDENKLDLFDKLVGEASEKEVEDWKSKHDGHFLYENWRAAQMSLSPEYCKIVGLNWMEQGDDPHSYWVGENLEIKATSTLVTEDQLLKKFWTLAGKHGTIITYNGLSFDLEVIKSRSASLYVPATVDLSNLKPWENKVIDLMKRMFSNRKAMGLKKVREIYWTQMLKHEIGLLKYKDIMDMSGGEVDQLYRAGDYEKLIRYGEFDAITNVALYRFGLGYWW